MKYYKVCKYNLNDQSYLDEWTTIEQAIDENKVDEYLEVEKNYLTFAMNFFNIQNKIILENHEDYRTKEDKLLLNQIGIKRKKITASMLPMPMEDFVTYIILIQESLRRYTWSRMKKDDAYIAFGHDYYLHIAIDDTISIEDLLQNTNLYAYEWFNIFE